MNMRTVLKRAIFGLLGSFTLTHFSARADLEVTASVQIHAKAEFDVPLAEHGTWVEVGSYGRCWRPAHVAVEWRPYCSGEWVWTDCGWYWSSDEPWAWACYHYGSWVYDPAAGWVWVPGVEWAPAWVSWRVGGGYIGWAPLPPQGFFFARHPEPELFVFVGSGSFGGPVRPGAVIVRNTVIINHTTELGGIKRESRTFGAASAQKVMVNHGPALETVQKASGRTFASVSIQEAVRRTSLRSQTAHAVTRPSSNHDERRADKDSDHGSEHSSDRVDGRENDHSGNPWGGGGADQGSRSHGKREKH
jgi:hypothetical protein